jgi:uncharacterized protein YcbK (DUF882 family)
MVLNPFCSYLQLFKLDNEKCLQVRHRIDFVETNIKLVGHKLESSYDINPVLIVSASKLDFGQILFVNKPFCDLAGKSSEFVLNKAIFSFFPQSFSMFSVEALKRFKEKVSQSTKYLKQNLVMKISEDCLLEVSLNVTLMSYAKAFYLISLEKLDLNREVLVFNKDKIVEASSSGLNRIFPDILTLNGRKVEDFLPVTLSLLKNRENHEIFLQHPPFIIQYSKLNINNCKIRMLFFYSDYQMKTRSDLGDLLSSKKYRKSMMLDKKEVSSIKFLFNPVFISEHVSQKSSKKEEQISLIESTTTPHRKKLQRFQQNSLKYLKFFHWLVVFSVIFS